MRRRSTDVLERELKGWEAVRRAFSAAVACHVIDFIDREVAKLHHELVLRERPRIWGRRASDPKPVLPQPYP